MVMNRQKASCGSETSTHVPLQAAARPSQFMAPYQLEFQRDYPLVNVYIAIENGNL